MAAPVNIYTYWIGIIFEPIHTYKIYPKLDKSWISNLKAINTGYGFEQ